MSTTSDSSNSDSSDSHTTTTDQDNHCISWKNKKFISYKLKSRAPSTALWNEDQKAEWDELKGFAENLKTKVTISEEYSIDSSRTNRRKSISKTKFPEVDDRKEEHLLNLDYNPNSFQNTRYGDTHDADAAINQECNLSPGYTRQQRNKVPTNSSKRYDQRMYSKLNSPDPPPRRQNQYSRSRNESSRNDDLEEKWFKDIEDEVCQKYGITLPEDLYLQLPQGQQQIKLFRQQPRTSSSLQIDSELIKTYGAEPHMDTKNKFQSQQKAKAIRSNNIKMVQRLENVKSQYSRDDFLKDYKWHERFVVCRRPVAKPENFARICKYQQQLNAKNKTNSKAREYMNDRKWNDRS